LSEGAESVAAFNVGVGDVEGDCNRNNMLIDRGLRPPQREHESVIGVGQIY